MNSKADAKSLIAIGSLIFVLFVAFPLFASKIGIAKFIHKLDFLAYVYIPIFIVGIISVIVGVFRLYRIGVFQKKDAGSQTKITSIFQNDYKNPIYAHFIIKKISKLINYSSIAVFPLTFIALLLYWTKDSMDIVFRSTLEVIIGYNFKEYLDAFLWIILGGLALKYLIYKVEHLQELWSASRKAAAIWHMLKALFILLFIILFYFFTMLAQFTNWG